MVMVFLLAGLRCGGSGCARSGDSQQVGSNGQNGNRDDRQQHAPGLDGQGDPVFVDHQPPVGGGWLHPQTQEGQRGDGADGVGQSQAGFDRDGAGDVGENFARQDLPARHRVHLGGHNVVLGGDREGGGPGYSCHAGCVGEPDHQDQHPAGGSEDHDGQQGQDQLWEGQDDVVGAHDERVEKSARVGGDHAHDGPDEDADDGGGNRVPQQEQIAGQKAGGDGPAQIIGAENSDAFEGFTHELGGGVAGEGFGKRCAQHGDQEHDNGEDGADFAGGLVPHPGREGASGGTGGL